ncbi:hypothetical protein ACN20G_25430 [Streptomyces sp. BI20]|uniref:hypothetical protein n=1 Tax=Streptomyces sp. BI20 TaxID=3403460 RepID=UPI003C74FDF6
MTRPRDTDPVDPRRTHEPGPEGRAPADSDYSATVLGSHWFSGGPIAGPAPDPPDTAETLTLPVLAAPTPTATLPAPPSDTASFTDVPPDRVEGSLLRFGPGVTASAPVPFPVTPPPPRRGGRLRGLRRYALAGAVLLAVLLWLGWDRFGPGPAVRSVTVGVPAGDPGCGGTAEITAVLATDGRPGTVRYQWVRNDGTASEVLTERLARGQDRATLRMLWTFRGEGSYAARAELRLLDPAHPPASAAFAYRCAR